MTKPPSLPGGDPADTWPFYRLLGLRSEAGLPVGTSRLHLTGRDEFLNSHGDIHGGVVAALLDATMGGAARSAYSAEQAATTVSMTVNYLEPAREALIGEGRVVRAGQSLASVEATVKDRTGRIVAHAIGTLRIVRRRT